MESITGYFDIVFRWLHVIFGIIWIGLLYFFNFVNGPFQGTIDGDTKKKVNPELVPRALFWFRWGAAWTWITGVLLLSLVFYHSRAFLDNPQGGWTAAAGIMILVTFLVVFLYDALAKSPLNKDPKVFGTIAFVLIAALVLAFVYVGEFGWRGTNIHLGTAFGTIMAFNVWYRIWPAQQKIIRGLKEGNPAPADVVALAGNRSRHNTYMSVPLIFTMVNLHTTTLAGSMAWMSILVVVLIGWHLVFQFYKRAGKVQGF